MERKKVDIHQFLREIYYRLLWAGYEDISLRKEDLLDYVPQMEELVKASDFDLDDLFLKTPVSGNYDKYKDYLISTFVQDGVGYLNDNYDTITLVNNPDLIRKNVMNCNDSTRLACLCVMEVVVTLEKQISDIKAKIK